jgi:hypothetical protein
MDSRLEFCANPATQRRSAMASAQDRDMARKAWDQVTGGIQGAKAELADLREPFVQAVDKGEPLTEVEDQLQDRLAEVEWTWPWFEESYAKFDNWRMFPVLWPQLVPEPDEENPYSPDELAAYRRAGIAPLIAHTAAMIFFRERHLSKAHQHMKYKLAHKGDPAEMRSASEHEAKIVAGDYSVMPPFFPGDRTALEPDSPIGAELSLAAAGAIVPPGADMSGLENQPAAPEDAPKPDEPKAD